MYEFPYWYESKDGKDVIFLQDQDIECAWTAISNDVIGHRSIEKIYPVPPGYIGKEGFPCHPAVADAIRNGKMDRMMRMARMKASVNKSGKLDGLYELYYDGGNLLQRCMYKDGVKDGLCELYYDSGNLLQRYTYRNGKLDGLWESYDDSGNLLVRCTYRNGKMEERKYSERNEENMFNLENLSKGERFIVKWQYGMLGDFETALMECIKLADDKNLLNIACGFTEEVSGYMNYTRVEGWWDAVKKRASLTDDLKRRETEGE